MVGASAGIGVGQARSWNPTLPGLFPYVKVISFHHGSGARGCALTAGELA